MTPFGAQSYGGRRRRVAVILSSVCLVGSMTATPSVTRLNASTLKPPDRSRVVVAAYPVSTRWKHLGDQASEQPVLSPPSSVIVVGAPPAHRPVVPVQTLVSRCGRGDLEVGAGQTIVLGGFHQYPHICVYNGGTIQARGALTLRAQTIFVDATARITADGTNTVRHATAPPGWQDDRTTVLPGAPGRTGNPRNDPPDVYPGAGDGNGAGGTGGGVLILIARRIAIAGRFSVAGTAGHQGVGSHCQYEGSCPASGNGGDGESGESIRLVAHEMQLIGSISTIGGVGGPPGINVTNQYGHGPRGRMGQHGHLGVVKLFVDIVRAPSGALRIVETTILGVTTPGGHVPPPTNTGGVSMSRQVYSIFALAVMRA